MTDAPFRIRLGTLADIPVLARHRVWMFVDMGSLAAGSPEAALTDAATRRLLAEAIPSGEWVAWVAEDESGILGSGSALLRRLAPRPGHPEGGTEAYLLSLFTEHAARRRGVATAVMRACLAWCAERGITRITLHASAEGRRVYEPLGFVTREGEMFWRAATPDTPAR
jgi:GNAT superfamily N-acetyltransferase